MHSEKGARDTCGSVADKFVETHTVYVREHGSPLRWAFGVRKALPWGSSQAGGQFWKSDQGDNDLRVGWPNNTNVSRHSEHSSWAG